MKTKIYLLFVLCLSYFGSFGQSCIENVELGTTPWGGDVTLEVDSFLVGADPDETYTVSPSVVSCDDVGSDITVTISDANGFTCTSNLTLVDNVPPALIVEVDVVLELDANGNGTLAIEDIDEGSYDNCTGITYELSQSEFTCDDAGEQLISLTVTDEYGNWNQGWVNVIVVSPDDITPPTIVANSNLNVSFDNNGEAILTFDMVEEGSGSFDNCGPVTKSLSKTFFDCDDAGEQNVILTVTDAAGNQSAELITINFEDKIAPTPYVISLSTAVLSTGSNDLVPSVKLYAEDFDLGSYDNCGIVEMTINKDVYTCEDLGENEVIFTVYDEAGNSDFALVNLTIVDNSVSTTSIACNDEVTYSTFNNLPYTVSPYDLLEGGPYGCDFIFFLEIEDESGTVIPNNLITAEYLGQTLSYTIFDWNTGNSCWGTIVVTDEDPGCDFSGEDDINWPLELIEIDLLNVDASDVTPDYIGNQVGYTFADAYPTIDLDSCNLIGIAYEDTVIPAGLFSYKILRQFTVVDWINFDQGTGVGIYEFTQIIKNNNYPAWYICDTLPRSAPLGDCDSGHTLDDHVEWPNDITIEDHRITPVELINYSGIELEDSEPQFYGEDAEFYELTYQDLVNDLGTEDIIIDRVWTVTHLDIPGIDFSYTQEITVTFSEFSNLVAVNTHGNRGVPQVDLGNNFMTDNFGKAIIDDEFAINPEFSTAPLNGLDITDVYLIRSHILGMSELDEYQLIAADLNSEMADNQGVTTLDLVLLQRIILGINEDTEEWSFVDITDNNEGLNSVKGHYVAIKTGDVDDSALLPGATSSSLDNVNLSFEDELLNAGEFYSVPFYSDAMINASGIELRMNFDADIIDIESFALNSDLFGDQISFHPIIGPDPSESLLTILVTDVEEAHLLDGTETLFEISFQSKENSVLHKGLNFNEEARSFMIDEELTKYRINGSVDNSIGVGTNDEEFAAAISVFPNPAVDYINIDMTQTNIINDYIVSLYDVEGRQIISQNNREQITTSTLPTGSYVLTVTSGDKYYSQVVQVTR